MAIRLAVRTNTSIEYFKNLPLMDFMRLTHEIVEVFQREEGEG